MRFVNETDHEVEYTLFGGPESLHLSKGWVDPGDTDEWCAPTPRDDLPCTIHILVNGEAIIRDLVSSDRLVLREASGALVLEGGTETE